MYLVTALLLALKLTTSCHNSFTAKGSTQYVFGHKTLQAHFQQNLCYGNTCYNLPEADVAGELFMATL